MEKAKNIPEGRCISSTDQGSRYLILPIYDNINSRPKEVKFQLRYFAYKK
jgi:hypothetical protein